MNFCSQKEEDIGNIWLQQDGATCHTAEVTLDVVWPPRSCDLTALGYYFWGAIKDKCYADKPETIDEG